MISTHARSALLSALLVTSIAACAAPLQNGGVEVQPGAEERLEVMCRYGSAAQQRVCMAPSEEEER